MKLTKKQINKLESALKKANLYEIKSQNAAANLASLICEFTEIDGLVDRLQGDGFGFTPASNNDTHVSIEFIIKAGREGVDITEQYILNNLSL